MGPSKNPDYLIDNFKLTTHLWHEHGNAGVKLYPNLIRPLRYGPPNEEEPAPTTRSRRFLASSWLAPSDNVAEQVSFFLIFL